MTDYCSANVNIWPRRNLYSIYFFLINLFLNLVKKLPAPFNDDPEELTSFNLLRAYLNSIIPDTNNQYYIFDLHLLEQM